jgi:hypothetical protein
MERTLRILLDVEATAFFLVMIGIKLWIKAKASESPIVFVFGYPPTFCGLLVIAAIVAVGLFNVVWLSRRLHEWRNRFA